MQPLKSLYIAALLLSGCAVTVPNLTVCAPVEGIPGIAALCRTTNTSEASRLTIDEFFDFIYAQDVRPDFHDPTGKTMLPLKGPALCVSSADYAKNETAIAQLCVDAKCNYDQTKLLSTVQKNIDTIIRQTMPVIK